MIRVMVADDHPHVAIALRTLLLETADIRLVAETRQGNEVLTLVQQHRPEILFLDLAMGQAYDALATVRALRRNDPELKICVLSAFMEPVYVRDLLQAGVCGYILKDDDYVTHIERIVRDLMAGQLYLSEQAYAGLAEATRMSNDGQLLTERERDVLLFAARGLPNPQIGQALHLSAGTVRNILSTLYEKLGVRNRQEALLAAKERRLI
jgi:two-component system, NarL family, response regulator DesR